MPVNFCVLVAIEEQVLSKYEFTPSTDLIIMAHQIIIGACLLK